jgi:ketosteroid isomerase-like protein
VSTEDTRHVIAGCVAALQRGDTGALRDYAVVFRVTGERIDAVTEYCDTSNMKRTLFGQ